MAQAAVCMLVCIRVNAAMLSLPVAKAVGSIQLGNQN